MNERVNVVVTCTERKSAPIPRELLLRTVTGKTVEERAAAWIKRLKSRSLGRIPVSRLYSGDHWSVVLSLPKVAAGSGLSAQFWVCSAGYGLLSMGSEVSPYSATFSPNARDYVCRGTREGSSQSWWKSLSDWPGPDRPHPRSLAELADSDRGSTLVIVASPSYLEAIAPDLNLAASALSRRDRLLVVSGGAAASGQFAEYLVPCDARLRKVVGGALHSLNVRLARKLLEEAQKCPLRTSLLREKYRRYVDNLPRLRKYGRSPLSDEEVRDFAHGNLRRDPTATHSGLLRMLRKSGRACEQARFKRLFKSAKEERNGSRS